MIQLTIKKRMLQITVLTMLALQGCAGTANVITGVSFSKLSQRPNSFCDGLDANERRQCTPELLESLRFAEIGKEIDIFPDGHGTCGQASVDFGDGTPPSRFMNQVIDRNGTWKVTHTYNGWPGKKLVRVKGESGCHGDVTKEITVGIGSGGREDFNLGLCFGPCSAPMPITSGSSEEIMIPPTPSAERRRSRW